MGKVARSNHFGQQKSQLFLKDIEEDTKKLVREIKQSEKKISRFFHYAKKMSRLWLKLTGKNTKDGKILRLYKPRMFLSSAKDPKVSNPVAHKCHKKWSS